MNSKVEVEKENTVCPKCNLKRRSADGQLLCGCNSKISFLARIQALGRGGDLTPGTPEKGELMERANKRFFTR